MEDHLLNNDWIYWLPLLVLAWATLGAFQSRKFLTEVARRAHNRRVFFEQGTRFPLDAAPIVSGEELSGKAIEQALFEIATFAKAQQPDWILGVHVGGRLLSVAISDLIGLGPERCLFVSTHQSRNRHFKIESEGDGPLGEVAGRMLVIDDISRSGATLRNLKNFLHEENYAGAFKLSKVVFAVLIVASESAERFRPDWFYLRSLVRYFRLPWTDLSLKVATAYDNRESGKELRDRGQAKLAVPYDEFLIADHEKQARSFGYALRVAREHLPIDAVRAKLQLAQIGSTNADA